MQITSLKYFSWCIELANRISSFTRLNLELTWLIEIEIGSLRIRKLGKIPHVAIQKGREDVNLTKDILLDAWKSFENQTVISSHQRTLLEHRANAEFRT
jgi:hypothetical protein